MGAAGIESPSSILDDETFTVTASLSRALVSPLIATLLTVFPLMGVADELPSSLQRRFSQADRDTDQGLSRQEAAQRWKWAARNFDGLDGDGDGKLTLPELNAKYREVIRKSAREFEQADGNRDGYLTREEAARLDPELARRFDAIDTDKDGRISQEEYRRFFNRQPSPFWEKQFTAPAQVQIPLK